MRYFITGIGTGVGKTVVSAIITEALQADYWKPVQAGDLDYSDTQIVKNLVSNNGSTFHPEAFKLKNTMSPHAAAALEGIEIIPEEIIIPGTENDLVIEGAGGVMVPLNSRQTMLDLMLLTDAEIVLVSLNYLGSINHTLLSWQILEVHNLRIKGIIFNGEENREGENFILRHTGLPMLLRINQEQVLTRELIRQYAALIKENLK
ncbi:MAG TPA: dethiobiotin synthase [Sphingobacteriaceae bacterium]|nr:dethiobiotin synthase [Sphingobacteriaceae bacterium]